MTSIQFRTVPTLLILLLSFSGSAQFKKYESKTDFQKQQQQQQAKPAEQNSPQNSNPQGNKDQRKKSVKTLLDKKQNNNSEDMFGRGTGINQAGQGKGDDKYVNLNPETAFGPEVVKSFDFPDTSLVELTKHMQKLTGINLIMEQDLKGKISIMAPSPITVGDAWKAYLQALNINGYTLVKSGSFYKIVNSRDIRYTPTKIYTGNYTPDTANYVMRIIPLKNINVAEVTRSFRPFMSRYGRIIDIEQTNTIIIQDTGSNINRLVRLIKFIDVPGHEESLRIIPVEHSSAQEIAKLLDQILKGSDGVSRSRRSRNQGGGGGSASDSNISKIIAEPRTNSIIAMANAEGAKQLRGLIKKLDVETSKNQEGQIHVYYLNHGNAEDLAKTLSTLISGAQSSDSRSSRVSGNRDGRGGAQQDEALFSDDVKVTADKANNALVVTASPTDYLTIKKVIGKLDIPRDQVYVEGLIMETNVNRDKGFGINIIGAYGSGAAQKAGFQGGGGGGASFMDLLSNNITNLSGLFIGGGAGKKVTQNVGGQEVELQSVNALLTAIAQNSSTNVLATPQILALDNTEASFSVGETVPIPQRTITDSGTTVSTETQKVALTIKLTPQINKVTRFVKLKIDQEIEDFSQRNLPEGLQESGVATTTRSAVTTVVVRDRDTIAMGGLMRDKETTSETKVPLLGDIPVLGWLFKNQSSSVQKVNLLFFLTPKILANYQETAANTVKDVLNRRSNHLKGAFGGDDPFGTTIKGIYDKADKQGQGPLYDEDESSRYNEETIEGVDKGQQQGRPSESERKRESRSDVEGILEGKAKKDNGKESNQRAKAPSVKLQAPDYQKILQKVKQKKSSVEKDD